MKLEDIGVEPCLFTEASLIQRVDFDDGCQLFIPVKSEEQGAEAKQRIIDFYYGEK
jgi:hypothetical protein